MGGIKVLHKCASRVEWRERRIAAEVCNVEDVGDLDRLSSIPVGVL